MRLIALAALAYTLAAADAPSLTDRVAATLRGGGPGTRFGLVVTDMGGREIVAIDPDARYIPASNTKMFTTAAAFLTLDGLDAPDANGGAAVRLAERDGGVPDLVLEGHGDARLSAAADCTSDCLATLADAVAAETHRVHDVVGDDSAFPDERWSSGMSWNNIPTRSGTGLSALTIDDNEIPMTVTPGAAIGAPPGVTLPYLTLDNRAVTVAHGKTDLAFDRAPNSRLLRLTGTIALGAAPETLKLGVDDPADYAAWLLRAMLEQRGVRVTGNVTTHHRPLMPGDDPAVRQGAPAAHPPAEPVLAKLVPPPLGEDIVHTNKVSQNLHAELLLRRIALKTGSGSVADGLAVVRAMLAAAGVPRADYDFADGSGMSTYNRVAPRGVALFLRWIAGQPWGAAWRATLPVGGVGMLKRYAGTDLDGKVFAKTGSLNATNALSGYMTAASGRTLVFASYANDVPEGQNATRAVDKALELVAAEN